jgi:hypothetical protein
MARQCE